jgi:hypothetical protein
VKIYAHGWTRVLDDVDAGAPAGMVAFRLDGKAVRTAAVTNGKATYTPPGRPPSGRHAATAEFMPADPTGVQRSLSGTVKVSRH